MAMMEALLKIRADVQGEGRINALGKALGGLNNTAKQVGGGLSGLADSLGGLGGPLGSLAGLATGAGLAALAKNAIDTADNLRDMSIRTGVSVEMLSKLKTAAEMSGATIDDVGKALTRTAAAIANAPSAAANTATNALAAGTNSLKLSIQQQVELIQRREQLQVEAIKNGAQRQIQEVQNRERQQIDAVRAGMERALTAVKDGEQRQVDAIDRAAEQRINRLERETDARLREISRRYRQEEKLLNDSYDDARDRAQQAADDELRVLERRIERRYDVQRKAIQADKSLSDGARDAQLQTLQDQQEDELKVLRNGFSEKAKIRDRQFRDQQEQAQQAIEDRRRQEEDAEKARTEALKTAVNDRAKAEKDAVARASAERQAAIKKNGQAEELAIKASNAATIKVIRDNADAMVKGIQDGNKRAQDAYAKLGVALRNADGSARKPGEVFLDLFDALRKLPNDMERAAAVIDVYGAKLGPKLLPMFAMPREEIEKLAATITTDFANAADRLNDKQTEISNSFLKLGVGIGQVLLPVVETLANALNGVVNALSSLPEPVRDFLVTMGLIGLAVKPLLTVAGVLSGLKLGALIAGWAPVIVAAMAQIAAALTIATSAIIGILGGILTWVGSTLIPGLLAFFSGPVGWTVLAIAAVVAMVIAFRKPLGEFLIWLWQWGEPLRAFFVNLWNSIPQLLAGAVVNIKKGLAGLGQWFVGAWSTISKGFSLYVAQPIANAWNALIQMLPNAMSKAVQFMQNTWTGMINAIRSALRGFLVSIANGINSVAGAVNKAIAAYNNLPGSPNLPFVPTIQVQPFAKGGVVNRATLAMVGEGGEREYIVPESKMARASVAYLSGSRGAAVLQGAAPRAMAATAGSSQSNRPISINVKTGPVMEFNGGRYVKVEELDRAMRITAEGVMGRLRTPAARVALGIR